MSEGSKRSFAHKILKQSNAEVRRQIAATSAPGPDPVSGGESRPASGLSFFSEVLLSDVVDPPDFEDSLSHYIQRNTGDPHKELLEFPLDDLEVCLVARKVRTLRPILPDYEDLNDQEDHYINECIRCYTSNWVVVNKKYESKAYSEERKVEREALAKSIPKQEYEIDIDSRLLANGSNGSSQDKTPNACFSPSTGNTANNSRAQSLILNGNVRPPLASDEETSEGSLTPPSKRESMFMADSESTFSCTSSETTPRNSALFIEGTQSRNSWHFIDSPCNSIFIEGKRNSRFSVTSRDSRTSRIFDLRNSQSDPLLHGLLDENTPDEVDRINEIRRLDGRHPALFALYPTEAEESIIENRVPAQSPKEHLGHRILVKCLSLKLDLEIEPIFASLALYDAKEKKKISENFYFDLNPEQLKRMLSSHIPYQDISTLSRACIFDITYPSNDLFLVIKLEKVLQGDVNDSIDPYMKDDKNRERLKSNAFLCCEKLGKYRQPFAWTAVYLLDAFSGINNVNGMVNGNDTNNESHNDVGSLDRRGFGSATNGIADVSRRKFTDSLSRKGSLERPKSDKRRSWSQEELSDAISNFHPVTLTINSFFKQDYDRLKDEDLYKFLMDLKRPSSTLKRLKCIPGVLKLDISPCPEEQPKYSLSPELNRLHPYPDDKGRPVKELVELPTKEVLTPHYLYRNLLFLSPRSLNFTNRPGSARNITCKVQLMSGEDDYSALPAIFGKSSSPEFSSEAYTAVSYHNKCPDFNDEIKMKLPTKLTDQHHLLFTFYHISCQKTKQNEPNAIDTPLGYTWHPLYREGRLQTGNFSLPVMMEKPPASYSFLTPFIQIPNTKWVDNHKDVFTITVEAVSTVHTQDQFLDNFLRLATQIEEQNIPIKLQNSNIENEFKTSILSISKAQTEPLVKFFPLLMNKLVKLLVRPPVVAGNQILNIGQTVFEAMASVVQKVSTVSEKGIDFRNPLLTTFVNFQCLFPHPEAFPPRAGDPCDTPLYVGYAKGQCPPQHMRSNSNPNVGNAVELSSSRSAHNLERACSLRSPPPQAHQDGNIYLVNRGFVATFRKLFHEELLLQWVVSSGTARELALLNSHFFFELMIKSASENLAITGGLDLPRKCRFTQQFTDDVNTLVHSISAELVNRLNRDVKDMQLLNNLNCGLAFFIRDLFTLADRGFVFILIRNYCKQLMNTYNHSEAAANYLLSLKLEFLRIVCNHEHFITLNLPFDSPLFPSKTLERSASFTSINSHNSIFSNFALLDRISSFADLSDEYRRQHYMIGLVLSSLASSLEINNASIHSKAVNLVRVLMTSHDWDPRYSETDVRSRVAALYVPLITIVMDALPQLYDWKTETGSNSNSNRSSGTLKKNGEKRKPFVMRNNDSSEGDSPRSPTDQTVDQTIAMAIAGSTVYSVNASAVNYEPRRWPLREDTTRDLLLCFIWVLKNASNRLLRRWWSELPVHRLTQLIDVLQVCASCFEYKGKQSTKKMSQSTLKKNSDLKSRLEDAILGLGSARRELMLRRRDRNPTHGSQSFSQGDTLRWRKDNLQPRYSTGTIRLEKSKIDMETESTLQGHLSTEVLMVILDTIESINYIMSQESDVSSDNLKQCQLLLGNILHLIITSLSLNQSTLALQNIFAIQRSLVTKYPSLIFEERFDRELCSELCLQLLRHCSSSVSAVRAQAAASLYLLMRQNFNVASNFAKIKMQVTMSLSSLVGTSQTFSEKCLRRSLKTILVYAVVDKNFQETNFPDQVQELIFNLHMILSDTIRMKEYQEDPEMLLDLMYRIAKGYQNSPDLRLTWLSSMAQKLMDRGNHTEAAHCFIHSAALVAEYLHVLENKPYLPVSCVAFQKISANILEESIITNEMPTDREGLCTGKSFTETGLVGLLEKAASAFSVAGMYEIVNEVFKLLVPVAEAHRDYKKLASIHGKLQDAFTKIEQQTGKRVFGTYFRVGFYGLKFGDLDGEEFVYKEPFLTKLAEIAQRLESFYVAQFGANYVEVIKDSNTVDVIKLDPEKVYIQITYVEPYFDTWELEQRQTYFERNYNIKRFLYSTPFTHDGRAHGDLHEQYKRKTIVTTLNAFPYVKNRVQVQDRQQVTLTPIEVAIDDILKKTAELAVVTYQDPTDPKILQMVLQGCIGTTVNQGPLEVANVFLSDTPKTSQQRSPSPLQNKLRCCFKDFCRKCGDALRKNRSLIGPDQKEYQRELERNYHKFTERLAPMISNNGPAALRALRESYWNYSSKHKTSPVV